MAQVTFQADPKALENIEAVKNFIGTRSTAAAIRGALLISTALARTAKDGVITLVDQSDGSLTKVELA